MQPTLLNPDMNYLIDRHPSPLPEGKGAGLLAFLPR